MTLRFTPAQPPRRCITTTTPSTTTPTAPRLDAIDQFRGLAIVGMVLVNYLAGVENVPAWMKHAPDVGLTVADLVAPLFIFAIGLTYGLSLRRRIGREGLGPTVLHFGKRFAALLGIGFLLTIAEGWFGQNPSGINWGVLQTIGLAGLLVLPFLFLPAWPRAGAGLVLLGSYQWLLDRYWLDTVLHSPHGGIQGALGWTAMLILATALADLFFDEKGRRFYPWVALLVLLAGVALWSISPVSKNRVSAAYVLTSLGASAGTFAFFHFLVDRLRLRLPLLSSWGKNPLLLYLLHYVLLGLVVLPGVPGWYTAAPAWLVALQALALLAALSGIARYLEKKGWFIFL